MIQTSICVTEGNACFGDISAKYLAQTSVPSVFCIGMQFNTGSTIPTHLVLIDLLSNYDFQTRKFRALCNKSGCSIHTCTSRFLGVSQHFGLVIGNSVTYLPMLWLHSDCHVHVRNLYETISIVWKCCAEHIMNTLWTEGFCDNKSQFGMHCRFSSMKDICRLLKSHFHTL